MDGALRLWDLDGPRPRLRLERKNETKSWDTVALSPDGSVLATAVRDGRLCLWTVSPDGLKLLAEHKGGAEALSFTPDGKTLFAANGTAPVRAIDLSKPTAISAELTTGQGFYNYGQAFTTTPDFGKPPDFLEPILTPVQLATGQGAKPLNVHKLAVSPDGRTLAVSGDGEMEVWERNKDSWSRRSGFWLFTTYVRSMTFARPGQTLIVGTGNGGGDIRRFDVSDKHPVQLGGVLDQKAPVSSVAASPNGKFIAVADERGRVIVWTDGMAKKLHEWTFPGPVRCVAFAPDGQHLALGNGDGTVYILRLKVPPTK